MARANWDTGYFQAAVFSALLEELGYEVSDPAASEMAPDEFYPRLASGEFDFWVNGWFPAHDPMLAEGVGTDGTTVAGLVTVMGTVVAGGGLQGYLVDKATAEELGLERLDQIGNDPEVAAHFDLDGDGLADLIGCNQGWGCQITIDATITANGWIDTIEQVSGDYNELWASTLDRYQSGQPILVYTWSPSSYIAQLISSEDVVWLSLESPLPDQIGASLLPPSHCPGQPCEMGFAAAEIRVVATNDFLAGNPVVARLFEIVGFQLIDIGLQNFAMANGENTEADIRSHAEEWIEVNRRVVDAWLDEARAAAS